MSRYALMFAATALALAAGGGFVHAARTQEKMRPTPDIPQVSRNYDPQKVVYHLAQANGWFADEHLRLLQTIKNHINAVGAQRLTVRVVLQGGGVDVLTRARTDADFRAEVDYLRANGVRFLVCRNTLVSRKIAMDGLHGVTVSDLVPAAVAETVDLMRLGFAYLKM